MLNKLILPFTVLLIFLFAISCGTKGMIGSDTETALTGVVLDSESFERIADATVQLVDEDRSTVTNENGVFTFVNIGVGSHNVIVESSNGETTETTIDVEAGGSRVEIKIGS